MDIQRINPATVHPPPPSTYTHLVSATGRKLIFSSMEGPLDADGNLVGKGDFEAQARQVFQNLRDILAAAAATFDNVLKMTIYVVDYSPELYPVLRRVRAEVVGDHPPASTLIGVAALPFEDLLIEADIVAVVD